MNPISNALAPIFSRFGCEVPVKRFSKSGSDRLNQPTGSWSLVGNTTCAKYYLTENDQTNMASGTRDNDKPHLIFGKDADVEDGDRIYFPSVTYEIQTLTVTHAYQLATVKGLD